MFSGKIKPRRDALLIAAGYGLLAAAYIIVSGWWAAGRAGTIEDLYALEKIKGLGFAVVTAIGLYFFARMLFGRYTAASERAERIQADAAEDKKRLESGLLAAGICHDANNVLTALRLGLDFLRQDADSGKVTKAILADIEGQVERLELMNRRLVEVSRDSVETVLRPLNLAEEMRQFLRETRHSSAFEKARVTVENMEGLQVLSDPLLLHQMIHNLVLNATESAGEQPRHVLVRALRHPYKVTLEVHDNGAGIAEDILPHIFQPFFTTKSTGTGLGLVSVRACARAQNGSVEAANSEILGGACLKVHLPVPKSADS